MTQMFNLRTIQEAGFVARPHSLLRSVGFGPRVTRHFSVSINTGTVYSVNVVAGSNEVVFLPKP